jgi:phosphatidylserine/phosphatidylglycerophosphate/cardiolipin synthase-like enzyme
MGVAAALEALAGRTLMRGLTPLHRLARRRHVRALAAGRAAAAQHLPADAWWGAEPRWFPAGTPPRRHNRALPLVHGDRYFAALRAALATAEDYVYVAAWCLTPHLPLGRNEPADFEATQLLTLLSETARRVPVRLLLWGGAPALIRPTTRIVAAVARTIETEGRGDLRVALDRTAGPPHTHHQKAVVVDGRLAFVGGIDLTSFAGDRWDTAGHPLRFGPNWHDVQLQMEGEAVADVEQNFRQRWGAVTGEANLPHRAPEADPAWQTPLQIVRTVPRRTYDFAPRGEYGIYHFYVEALGRAERLVYLENQYLWSPGVMDALVAALDRPRTGPFRVVVVLPARAYSGKWDNDRHVERLRAADGGRGMVGVYCPYASGPGIGVAAFAYRPIYVHAKVALVDDEWCTIGSANLNDRGLVTDGELNAVFRDPELTRRLRVELWAEHLGLPAAEVAAADPIVLVDTVWAERAAANRGTVAGADRPLTGTVLRYETGGTPGAWLLEEAELLTFER